MPSQQRFPWGPWMRQAASVWGISPNEFWMLSMADWRRLAQTGDEPMSRQELDVLIGLYPDELNERTNAATE